MTVQTAYSTEHGVSYPGMPADLQLLNTKTGLNSTGADIPFGKGVYTDTSDTPDIVDAIRLPVVADTDDAAFEGVLMYEINRAQADGVTVASAPDGRDASVITHGVVWVLAAVDITKNDPVFIRTSVALNGDFTNIAGGALTEGVAITGAKFVSSALAGEQVKISLGLGG